MTPSGSGSNESASNSADSATNWAPVFLMLTNLSAGATPLEPSDIDQKAHVILQRINFQLRALFQGRESDGREELLRLLALHTDSAISQRLIMAVMGLLV